MESVKQLGVCGMPLPTGSGIPESFTFILDEVEPTSFLSSKYKFKTCTNGAPSWSPIADLCGIGSATVMCAYGIDWFVSIELLGGDEVYLRTILEFLNSHISNSEDAAITARFKPDKDVFIL